MKRVVEMPIKEVIFKVCSFFVFLLTALFVHGQVFAGSITINGGFYSADFYGWYASGAATQSADSNSATVNAGNFDCGIYGGYANATANGYDASANNNTVSIFWGTLNGQINGGYANTQNGLSTADNNTVVINGGTFSNSNFISGGYSQTYEGSTSASNNAVTINNGTIGSNVYGGRAGNSLDGFSCADGNTVVITGGTVNGAVLGGEATVRQFYITSPIHANNNSITISGGVVNGGIVGGRADINIGAANATGNTVTISGGTINGGVTGGYAGTVVSNAFATGNTVIITGSPIFGPAAFLRGGDTNKGSEDVFSNNRLKIWNYTGNAVAQLLNFKYYNFLLPPSFTTASSAALTVTGNAKLNWIGNSSTIEAVDFAGGGPTRNNGDVYTLLRAGSMTGTITNNGQTITGKQGAALQYTILLTQNANTITATIISGGGSGGSGGSAATLNPQMKAVSEGRASGAIVVNQGGDLVAGQGINSAVMSTRGGQPAGSSRSGGSGGRAGGRGGARSSGATISSFGATSAGSTTYHTGSHVDTTGFSLAAGIALGTTVPCGELTVGPFFEFGAGTYNTYNSFANAPSVTGNGNMNYMGGGLLARLDFNDYGPGHFYVESSARVGNVHNRYNGGDLKDGFGRSASFDADVPYYGMHAGAGYVWNITESLSLDMYSKYFWTRQEANSVTLSTGDRVNYEAVDSNRLRLGGRMSYTVSESFSPYVGVAYEREFNGKAEATTYGQPITAPSLRGDTGIGELGLQYKPSPNIPLTFDLGVQGYAGKRDGITGSLQIKYEF